MAAEEQNGDRYERPLHLSIMHLLLWMTGAALLCSLQQNDPLPDDVPLVERVTYLALWLSTCIAGGVPLASLALLVPPLFRRRIPFPRQPGHWILLSIGAAMLVRVFYTLLIFPGLDFHGLEDFVRYYCFSNFMEWLASLFVLAVALVVIESGGWLIVFGVTMLAGLVQLTIDFLVSFVPNGMSAYVVSVADGGVTCLFALLVICQVVTEWSGKRRDWLHFTGVVLACYFAVQSIAWLAWQSFR